MGRPRQQEAIDLGRCRVRKDIGEPIFRLLEDPTKPGKIEYGSLKHLLEKLFAKHLRELDAISEDLLEEILNAGRPTESANK